MLSGFEIAFVLFALISSAFIKGSLGLGFSTICLAMLVHVLDLKTAISIVLLPSLLSNALVLLDTGHIRMSIQQFWLMLLMSVPGMFIGFQLLKQDNNTWSLLILSAVLVIYGIWGYRNHHKRLPIKSAPKANPVVGICTGIVNGATGSQVFPIMPYLLSLPIKKDLLVATVNLSFSLNSLIMLVALFSYDLIDRGSSVYFSLAIVPVLAGVWIGNKVRKKMNDTLYRKLAMVLMVALGLLLVVREVS